MPKNPAVPEADRKAVVLPRCLDVEKLRRNDVYGRGHCRKLCIWDGIFQGVRRDQPRTDSELTPNAPQSESPRGTGLPADSLSQARSSAIVAVRPLAPRPGFGRPVRALTRPEWQCGNRPSTDDHFVATGGSPVSVTSAQARRPVGVTILIVLLWIQALVSIAGGVALILLHKNHSLVHNAHASSSTLLAY